jgi:pimeloyl-ACP methyl ester carboxylesterase
VRLALLGVTLLLAGLLIACDDDDPEAPQPTDGASIETITTEDGLALDARLFAAPSDQNQGRLVILLHQYPDDQTAWYDTARALSDEGHSALTFDFRGYGASEGDRDPAGIDRDVVAALGFARDRGYEHVVLVGASMGGTAAIVAAAEEDVAVDGVLAISAPERFRTLDAEDAVTQLRSPLAIVAAKGDTSAATAAEAFEERANLDPKWVLLVDSRAHGTDLLTTPEARQVWDHLLAFLNEVWGAPTG